MKNPPVPSSINRRLIARDFVPGAGLQYNSVGGVQYRRSRQVTPLASPALDHFLQALGPASDYRVGRITLIGQCTPGLLLAWAGTPIAIHLCDEPDSLKATLALADYRGTPVAICHDHFYIQSKWSSALLDEDYLCPVLQCAIPRADTVTGRRFTFEIVEPDTAEIQARLKACRRAGFDSPL